MNNYLDYLEQSGILGQKWGQRNGPPYPLSGRQMSSAEKKKGGVSKSAKEKYGENQNKQKESIQEKEVSAPKTLAKPTDVYNNRNNVTDKELQAYLSRVNMEKQLKELSKKQYAAEHPVKTFMKEIMNDAKDAAKSAAKDYTKKKIKDAVTKALDNNFN